MKIITVADYDELSRIGAEIIIEQLKEKPESVLGLATGSTPIGLYGILAEACGRKKVSFSRVRTVNLDEYVGLGAESVHSYVSFMRRHLFGLVDIDIKNTHLPDGKAKDLQAECLRYTRLLMSMPQDIQLLGLGANGHIGFNEPGADFGGHTHVTDLTEKTIGDNSRLFEKIGDVPRRALTMGIADIMQAKRILLLASGENKAQAVRSMVKGEITESCPASILQRHENAVVVLDKAAASLL